METYITLEQWDRANELIKYSYGEYEFRKEEETNIQISFNEEGFLVISHPECGAGLIATWSDSQRNWVINGASAQWYNTRGVINNASKSYSGS